MSKALRPAAVAAAVAVAAALALPGGLAYAETSPLPVNAGNTSIASGDLLPLPLSLPVNVCGIPVAVPGSAWSGCLGGATVSCGPGNPGGPEAGPPPGGGTKTRTLPRKHHPEQPGYGHRGGAAATSTAMLTAGRLPTTGVNLAGILAAAAGCLAAGTGAVTMGRRRRGQHA